MPRLHAGIRQGGRGLAALVLMLAVVAGCRGGEGPGEGQGRDMGPMPDVNLPPVPQLQTDRPMSYPDGSISVWALTLQRQQHLGHDIQVTAYLKEIYLCPWRAQQEASDRLIEYNLYLTEDEREELVQVAMGTGEQPMDPLALGSGEGTGIQRCNYPHLWIADSMTAEHQILVTGYGPALEPMLQVGTRYLFEGRFMEETRGFNAAGQGLIYVTRISGGNIPETPPPDGEQIQIQ